MKKVLGLVLVGWLVVGLVRADTTLTITAANLRDGSGVLVPTNALAVLVVDTGQNGIAPLMTDSPLVLGGFIVGDDKIVGAWAVGYGSGEAGQLIDITPAIGYSGGVTQGEAVVLYWFPTLSLGATSVADGTPYGAYTDAVGVDGSAAWVLPADGATLVDLRLMTVEQGGSNPESAGWAASVVPEPSTMLLVALGLVGVVALPVSRRFRRCPSQREEQASALYPLGF